MSTARSESERDRKREKRFKLLRDAGGRRIDLRPPKVPWDELNADQRSLRIVLEVDFFGNRKQMADEIGMTSSGLARYVHTCVASPDYEMMARVGEAVGLSVDQLRSLGRGEIYVSASDEWMDPGAMTVRDRLRLANQFTDLEAEDGEEDDL